ncbi:MAG: TlpA disulfide reductase family protein [Usitatibacter sp.]
MKTNLLLRLSRILAVTFCATFPLYASAFDITDTQGKRHRLADYQGHWVVLNFWATWCVPCIQEIPEIAAFQKDNPRVIVIGIAVDAENAVKVKQFAKKVGHEYALVLSDDSVEKQLGDPRALPTTRIFDPAGKVTYDRPGRVTKKSLEEATASKPGAKAWAVSAHLSR